MLWFMSRKPYTRIRHPLIGRMQKIVERLYPGSNYALLPSDPSFTGSRPSDSSFRYTLHHHPIGNSPIPDRRPSYTPFHHTLRLHPINDRPIIDRKLYHPQNHHRNITRLALSTGVGGNAETLCQRSIGSCPSTSIEQLSYGSNGLYNKRTEVISGFSSVPPHAPSIRPFTQVSTPSTRNSS